jgi:hypothetical protein
LSGDTLNDGVFSPWNGHSPFRAAGLLQLNVPTDDSTMLRVADLGDDIVRGRGNARPIEAAAPPSVARDHDRSTRETEGPFSAVSLPPGSPPGLRTGRVDQHVDDEQQLADPQPEQRLDGVSYRRQAWDRGLVPES